jgi:hypothetical protein
MAPLRYTFRPSLFQRERTAVLDDAGIAIEYGGTSFRTPWSAIEEVHIEPMANTVDEHPRWLLKLRTGGGALISIDSVNVRGAADFEHKGAEFAAVVDAVHAALAQRDPPVRFRFGARAGIITAWRIALVLAVAAGLFGIAAAIATEDYEALFYAVPFAALALSGLLTLRGKRGPKSYDPGAFAASPPKSAS